TRVPAWRVVWTVTLRRAGAAVGAAALWVALQTAGEITVTDVMQVRTFAEEVYAHLSGLEAGERGLARAVAGSLGGPAVTAGLLAVRAWRWERITPGAYAPWASPRVFPLGRLRWPLAALVGLGLALLLGVPLAGLVYRVGLHGAPAAWSLPSALGQLRRTA